MQNIQKGNEDALNTDAIKFDIELQPLQTVGGLAVDENNRKAVVDITNGRVVGTCGKNYKPNAHWKVCELVNHGLRQSDIDLTDIVVEDNMFDNGAKFHRVITFPKIQKSLAKKDDIISLKLDIHSSLDLTRKISSIFNAVRLWCTNGCVTNDYNTQRSYKQTLGFLPEWLATNSVDALVNFEKNKQMFDRMLATSVDDDTVARFFQSTLAKLSKPSGNPVDGYVYHSEKKLTALMKHYHKEKPQCGGSNLWAVYNTMTHYSTHVDDIDWTGTEVDETGNIVQAQLTGARHNVAYNRQLDVAKSLTHELFKRVA